MFEQIDIQEDGILIKYPGVLQVLLYDHNSKKKTSLNNATFKKNRFCEETFF